MSTRARAIGLGLGSLAALALLAPAGALAGEPAATTPGASTPAAPTNAPPPTSPSTASAPRAPGASPETTATGESAPPPPPPLPGSNTPEVATTPQVQGQHKQGSTPGSAPAGHRRGKSNANAKGQTKPGTAAGTRAGRRAPSPSTLTPPLPLAFSSSLAGIPSFFIESFRIPPFLLPIYQAAGTAYGIPWQVLAAINEVETDYGRDLSVSSAGAEGWMQFLPSSWAIYGVDANGDGFKDPYNPADAIFAAARYLRAAGAALNLRGAIYAYNHSQAYVESVILRARLLGGTPAELLGALTGLTQARFPVHAPSHFSDGFPAASASASQAPTTIAGTTIYSQLGAPVIAVQDGRILQVGDSPALGHFISLRDGYGNTYTYARLASVAALYPVLKPHEPALTGAPARRSGETPEPPPSLPASAGTHPSGAGEVSNGSVSALGATAGLQSPPSAVAPPSTSAAPTTPGAFAPATPAASAPTPAPAAVSATARVFRAGPNDVYLHPLRRGVIVIAGTVLGHVGAGSARAGASPGEGGEPHMVFQIRPAGIGAPQIDPKPILDGWVALENSSIFRANARNPYPSSEPSPGQVLLESKQQLQRQVLANPGIVLSRCGRQDIQTDQIDRRVLATLEFLEVSGLKPTVSALKCARSGSDSAQATARKAGDSVDISAINQTPILGHQGAGSVTDTTIRKLLTLQGSMRPRQIVSLRSYPGSANTLASATHGGYIQVDFTAPFTVDARLAGAFSSAITPNEWIRLIARLGEIPNPTVSSGPSAASIPDQPGSANGKESGGNG